MKRIIAERVRHHGYSRISLRFDYDADLIALIKELPGARWSDSMRCWHISDDEKILKTGSKMLADKAVIDLTSMASGLAEKPCTGIRSGDIGEDSLAAPVPKSLSGKQSEPEKEDPGFKESGREGGMRTIRIVAHRDYGPVEFTIDESNDKLIIRFTGRYDDRWIKEMKSYGRADYDQIKREWIMDWSRMKVDSLSDYFASKGVEVIVKKTEIPLPVREQRQEKGLEIRARELGLEVMNGLEKARRYLNEKRYSHNTVEAYISLLVLFFKYFSEKDPDDITEDDIADFFHDFIAYHNYSASYHSQLVSAIKMYYKLNGSGNVDSSSLGRPRRRRALPKVFSKEEVSLILNSGRNIKHRLLLWMIYSCGLRRSEVTNIRFKDLDRDRGILNIREAKGMTDRIVPVSEKVWQKIDEYIGNYHPSTWLFEGQTGGRYSSESVYRVFKQALMNAGIRKDVGVHSLRHSYATHLHENGLDIRYIQELLGHKSSRTTEIYTHVSRRNLFAVRSPIEDLDLK